jgi:uncharacterized protein YqgV (UPF0045/DUF77 family)
MKITVELSLYPMTPEPVQEVLAFIAELEATDLHAAGIDIIVNQMSTQLCGELRSVLAVVERALERSFASSAGKVLVAKFLNKPLPIQQSPDLRPLG